MTLLEQLDAFGPEEVVVAREPAAGYTAVFVLHSTVLGPAVGGTRLRSYPSLEAALEDGLRLARGMTYKNALAGLPFGGGKSVILGPPPPDADARAELFRAHGRAIERLGGRYLTGEDVGTTTEDMAQVARETAHVGGLDAGMGDPSPSKRRAAVPPGWSAITSGPSSWVRGDAPECSAPNEIAATATSSHIVDIRAAGSARGAALVACRLGTH